MSTTTPRLPRGTCRRVADQTGLSCGQVWQAIYRTKNIEIKRLATKVARQIQIEEAAARAVEQEMRNACR
ncbi:MAG: hypothetical protein ABI876_01900 [Bacteroidota bacterium]